MRLEVDQRLREPQHDPDTHEAVVREERGGRMDQEPSERDSEEVPAEGSEREDNASLEQRSRRNLRERVPIDSLNEPAPDELLHDPFLVPWEPAIQQRTEHGWRRVHCGELLLRRALYVP